MSLEKQLEEYESVLSEARDGLRATDRRLLPSEKKALVFVAQEASRIAPNAMIAATFSLAGSILFVIVSAWPFAIAGFVITAISFMIARGADIRFHKCMNRLHAELQVEFDEVIDNFYKEIGINKEGKN